MPPDQFEGSFVAYLDPLEVSLIVPQGAKSHKPVRRIRRGRVKVASVVILGPVFQGRRTSAVRPVEEKSQLRRSFGASGPSG